MYPAYVVPRAWHWQAPMQLQGSISLPSKYSAPSTRFLAPFYSIVNSSPGRAFGKFVLTSAVTVSAAKCNHCVLSPIHIQLTRIQKNVGNVGSMRRIRHLTMTGKSLGSVGIGAFGSCTATRSDSLGLRITTRFILMTTRRTIDASLY